MTRAQLPLLITPLGELELTNAVALRLFRKEVSASQVKAALTLIRKDLQDGVLMVNALTASSFERAKQIARRQTPRLGTRTLELLHVASPLILQADAFYPFDPPHTQRATPQGPLV